jgi:hypothetical protein
MYLLIRSRFVCWVRAWRGKRSSQSLKKSTSSGVFVETGARAVWPLRWLAEHRVCARIVLPVERFRRARCTAPARGRYACT